MFSNSKAILALIFKVDKLSENLNLDVLSKVIDMFYFCNLKVFKSKVFAIKF